MMTHKKDHRISDLSIKLQSFTHALGYANPSRHVAFASPLADIVKQQTKIQRGCVFNLAKHPGEVRKLPVVIHPQQIEGLNGFQEVLVDRVFVIEVVLDQKSYVTKLRQQSRQESCFVHLSQRSGYSALSAEDFHKRLRGRL